MTLEMWKFRILNYKEDYKENLFDYALEVIFFILLFIFTPFILIIDIVMLPIYLLAYILKKYDNRR